MTSLDHRRLGKSDLTVFPLGLGCMGLSGSYGAVTPEDAEKLIMAAIEKGINLLDTADFYGRGANEELVGRCIRKHRQSIVVATKTGVGIGPDRRPVLKGRPEQLTAACDSSLTRLGTEVIDLFLLARVDPDVPIEESVGAMSDLVTKGKVREIGLSEASAQTIRRAHAVHALAAVQTEYSLAERSIEDEILPTLRELGITLIAYSPFGRGLLTGQISADVPLQDGDFRAANPRFSEENLAPNLDRAAYLEELGKKLGATNAQIALAWLLAQDTNIVPIFGTRSVDRLQANLQAPSLELTDAVLEDLNERFPVGWAQGERYPESMMALVGR